MSDMQIWMRDLGICCALGSAQQEVLQASLKGDQTGMCSEHHFLHDGSPTVVGRVTAELPSVSNFDRKFHSRNNQIALHCLQQIEISLKQVKDEFDAHRIAVVIGTSTSGISEGECALSAKGEQVSLVDDFNYCVQEMGNVAEFVQVAAKVSGPSFAISTACSSSAQALLTARDLIASGVADAVICGGVDSLCELTLNGFHALESLDLQLCQPFSANRKGINIGEGGALFIVQRGKGEIQLLGGGTASDAYHMSAPHPEGRGALTAMNKACKEADVIPSDIGYINLHGTATPLNDAMESLALQRLGAGSVLASSTKSLTGHTLGAAGAIEIGLCWLLLSSHNTQAKVVPHVWDQSIDDSIVPLRFATDTDVLEKSVCMSNSFAFGGSNVCVIIGKSEQ
ncbi:beta-ketoacyl-ACP synthase [Aliidiomarina indica]|uniref:beta-ketoacyl-ACP synthase n=1 Tax=Aliidiomarina indica TaxID=2749147 RepID=UPI001E4A5199|nr:beta-ketoacyl-ACP synthase [Aliidiomarina indica]